MCVTVLSSHRTIHLDWDFFASMVPRSSAVPAKAPKRCWAFFLSIATGKVAWILIPTVQFFIARVLLLVVMTVYFCFYNSQSMVAEASGEAVAHAHLFHSAWDD